MTNSILGDTAPPVEASIGTPGEPAPIIPADIPTEIHSDAPEWARGLELEHEILNDPSLRPIQDLKGLTKSFVHAQRMTGADKLMVPNKYAEESEWTNLFRKLGNPESLDDYKINGPEGVELNEDFLNNFRENSHKAGILPVQAQKLFDWYNEFSGNLLKQEDEARELEVKQGLDNLHKEWGGAYDSKIRAANAAIDKVGGGDLRDYLVNAGLDNNPQMIKMFSQMGEMFSDDSIHGQADPQLGKTPEEIKGSINSILGDANHPYNDKFHPNHKTAVAEVTELFAQSS